MKTYTYVLVLFLTVVVCFVFSFDRRIRFNQHFISYLKASLLTAVPFIAWDIWFTKTGVWWFDFDYTLGIKLAGMPLEEWLFFICIPFSCVFTFFFLDKFFRFKTVKKYNGLIAWTTILVCLAVTIIAYDKAYPMLTSVATILTMSYLYFIVKADWIGKASLIFLILMFGFFPVNGVLTGTGIESPIVNYNAAEMFNIRVFTIPIEDFVYGYTQFLLVLHFFQYFRAREELKKKTQVV